MFEPGAGPCRRNLNRVTANAALRCHCHWWRSRRHGSSPRVRTPRRAHAAVDAQHRNARPDELQPGDRRHRQRPSGQGDRRAGRRHGPRSRSRRHPVAHVERVERSGSARDPLPGGSRVVQGRDPAPPGNAARPFDFPAVGRRSDPGRQSRDRRGHPDGTQLGSRDRGSDGGRGPGRQIHRMASYAGSRAGDAPASVWPNACASCRCGVVG